MVSWKNLTLKNCFFSHSDFIPFDNGDFELLFPCGACGPCHEKEKVSSGGSLYGAGRWVTVVSAEGEGGLDGERLVGGGDRTVEGECGEDWTEGIGSGEAWESHVDGSVNGGEVRWRWGDQLGWMKGREGVVTGSSKRERHLKTWEFLYLKQ